MWLRSHYSGRVLVVAFSRSRSLMRKLHHQPHILAAHIQVQVQVLSDEQGHSVLFFIPSFIVSSILLSATGVKQNSLQEKIVDMTLKHSRENCGYDFVALNATVPEALASVTNASIRGFYRLAGSAHH